MKGNREIRHEEDSGRGWGLACARSFFFFVFKFLIFINLRQNFNSIAEFIDDDHRLSNFFASFNGSLTFGFGQTFGFFLLLLIKFLAAFFK